MQRIYSIVLLTALLCTVVTGEPFKFTHLAKDEIERLIRNETGRVDTQIYFTVMCNDGHTIPDPNCVQIENELGKALANIKK
jgi:hypothetical protein